MNFHIEMAASRKLIVSLLLASLLIVALSGAALAAPQPPEVCTQGSFQWVCTDGSEQYLEEPPAPISGQDGNGYFDSVIYAGAGLGGNAYVQLGRGISMRFKTSQQYGAWWDANDTLNVVEAVNGTITIPTGAVMIAIPGDILGNFGIPGWVKGQRTDTGEYVLGSTRWARQ